MNKLKQIYYKLKYRNIATSVAIIESSKKKKNDFEAACEEYAKTLKPCYKTNAEVLEYYNVLMDSYASEGNAELFKYGNLELEVTNVIEKKKHTASDGFESWEYDVYVVSDGARAFINNADMFYDDNKKSHPNWAFYTENEERINIVSEMKPIELTSDIKGVYDPESSVYVLMFEMAE